MQNCGWLRKKARTHGLFELVKNFQVEKMMKCIFAAYEHVSM